MSDKALLISYSNLFCISTQIVLFTIKLDIVATEFCPKFFINFKHIVTKGMIRYFDWYFIILALHYGQNKIIKFVHFSIHYTCLI